MSEREDPVAPSPTTPNNERPATWDSAALGQALAAEAEPVRDVAHGVGQQYRVGGLYTVALELYPDSGMARLISDNARIELFRQAPPTITKQGIIFEQHTDDQHLGVSLGPAGEVAVVLTPYNVRETGATGPSGPDIPADEDTAPTADSEAPQTPSQNLSPTPQTVSPMQQQDEKQEKQRVNLAGRVGRDPVLRQTPKGKLVAQFPLGTRDKEDAEKTHWTTIIAFDERASKVQETIKKGQAVDVVGYLHTKEQPGKEGKPAKTVQEVYAVVVKPR